MSEQFLNCVETKKELEVQLKGIIWDEAQEEVNSGGRGNLIEHYEKALGDDTDLAEAVVVAAREDTEGAFLKVASLYAQCSVGNPLSKFYESLCQSAVSVLRRARSRYEAFRILTKAEEEEFNKDGEWLRQARSAIANYLQD